MAKEKRHKMNSTPRIAILGGGLAGLTAAYELAKRKINFTLYEKEAVFGGKAVSFFTKEGFPGEHGLRIFPSQYKNMFRIMREMGVLDNLQGQTVFRFFQDHSPIEFPTSFGIINLLKLYLAKAKLSKIVPKHEMDYFFKQINRIGSMSQAERLNLDQLSWWDYMDTDHKSEAFKKYLIKASRILNAMDPITGSALTVGVQIYQVMKSIKTPFSMGYCNMLNAPTSISLLEPLISRIRDFSSDSLQANKEVSEIKVNQTDAGSKISEIQFADGSHIQVDQVIFALPLEVIAKKFPTIPYIQELTQSLGLFSGVQLFLKGDDYQFPLGISVLYDSPWDLSLIFQNPNLWTAYKLPAPLSAVISVGMVTWDKPGLITKKPILECSKEEIKMELIAQINLHKGLRLPETSVHDYLVDPTLEFSPDGKRVVYSNNRLFIPTTDSYRKRPKTIDPHMPINAFLAGDFTRTAYNVTSMEGAVESGLLAVNAVLEAIQSSQAKCPIYELG